MNAEIIAVGSEMLTPEKIDTNSLFLTQQLNQLGIEVVAKSIIGDDRIRLTEEVRSSMSRSDLIILTGGLGPTEDDVTRDAASAGLGISQHYEAAIWESIEARFRKFGRIPTENNRRQAQILDGAEILANPNGTAPGQFYARNGKVLVLLPGPPRELKPMVTDHVIPRLAGLVPPMVIRTRFYRIALMPESELDALIAPLYTKYENPATTVLAAPGDLQVHLRARCETAEEAERLLAELGDPVAALIGDRIYSTDGASLEEVVGRQLRAQNATVAVAESCTGGLLGAAFTEISGSSDYFLGGFLTYCDKSKHELLGIEQPMLDEHTAVSEPVALAMAAAAKAKTGAGYAVAITGYADGPQAGLIFIALATPSHTHARKLQLFGDRARVRSMAVLNALDLLRRQLL